jgi:hypothetical protein|tara:strand:+ start:3905 stop:4273 length:369 start_codon:yes stop_codon:yes gene_type:complete
VFKILKYLIITVLFFVSVTYLYVFREQDIIVDFIPPQFEFCDKLISKGDAEYDALVLLLNNNKSGWVSSFVSYAPSQVYYSPAFSVNILNSNVVVSYKTDNGFPQLVKKIKHDLGSVCAKYS